MKALRRDVAFRAMSFAFGVSLVFTALMRTVYYETATLSRAYEIRELRETEARLRNANDVLRAEIEPWRTVSVLQQKARAGGFVEVPSDRVLRVSLQHRDSSIRSAAD